MAETPVPVLDDLPVLEPDDEYEEIGVVWVPPAAVEMAAQALGLDLPEGWLQPEAREGFVADPEREEWRQYADTQESANEEESPLAEALRKAMQDGSQGTE